MEIIQKENIEENNLGDKAGKGLAFLCGTGLIASGFGIPATVLGAGIGYCTGRFAFSSFDTLLEAAYQFQQRAFNIEMVQAKRKALPIYLNRMRIENETQTLTKSQRIVDPLSGKVLIEAPANVQRNDPLILPGDVEKLESLPVKNIIDLIFEPTNRSCRHFLVAGGTGSGKSTFVNWLMHDLGKRLKERALLSVIDPNYMGEATSWEGCDLLAYNPDDAIEKLAGYASFIGELREDIIHNRKSLRNEKVEYIVVDEYNGLFDHSSENKDLQKLLVLSARKIYKEGRKLRKMIGVLLQSADVEQCKISTSDRSNFVMFFLGKEAATFLARQSKQVIPEQEKAYLSSKIRKYMDEGKYFALVMYEFGNYVVELPDLTEFSVVEQTSEFGDDKDIEQGFADNYGPVHPFIDSSAVEVLHERFTDEELHDYFENKSDLDILKAIRKHAKGKNPMDVQLSSKSFLADAGMKKGGNQKARAEEIRDLGIEIGYFEENTGA